MKKKLMLLLMLLLTISITGCSFISNDTSEDNRKTENKEEAKDKGIANDKSNSKNKSLVYPIVKTALNKAEQYNANIYQFEEREIVLNMLNTENSDEILNNLYYLKTTSSTIGRESTYRVNYKKTVDKTEFLYYGEFNDNSEPSGLGIIFQAFLLEDDEPLLLVKYIGNLKNGFYDGYGLSFECSDSFTFFDKEVYKKNYILFNGEGMSEGYFSEGVYNGKVNYFDCDISNAIRELNDPMDELLFNDLVYDIKIGTYENGTLNGDYTEYLYGEIAFTGKVIYGIPSGEGKEYQIYPLKHYLVYEGNFENGVHNGYGKEYSTTSGKLIYEGNFKNNQYHGKGILYDENTGKVIHDGEFSFGDIK